jgi:hypothetical protein
VRLGEASSTWAKEKQKYRATYPKDREETSRETRIPRLTPGKSPDPWQVPRGQWLRLKEQVAFHGESDRSTDFFEFFNGEVPKFPLTADHQTKRKALAQEACVRLIVVSERWV